MVSCGHVADTFLEHSPLWPDCGCSGYLHWEIAAGDAVVFLCAFELRAILPTYTTVVLVFRTVRPAEIRILLAAGNFVVLRSVPHVNSAGPQILSFDFGGAVAIAGMTVMVMSNSGAMRPNGSAVQGRNLTQLTHPTAVRAVRSLVHRRGIASVAHVLAEDMFFFDGVFSD